MATITAADTIDVENPATGQVIRSLPVTPLDEVGDLVARARAAQPAWEALGFEGRARVLRHMQKWMVDNAERVIGTIVDESGKTYEDAAVVELSYGAGACGFWAKNAPKYLADERVRTTNPFVLGRKLVVRYGPVGVVGVIGPWNYPLTNNFGDAIPALAAGNAVVLKPSQVTPLTSLLLAEGVRECGLPHDAIQVIIGGGDAAQLMIDAVDFVMFTGSTATGKKVMARAAETLTPVGLELGGKDPMIVLADADLERAANAATYYAMQNGGQTCVSVACVNDANVNYFAYELPMGGWKESGLGVRHGAAGIRKYTRQQAILVTRVAMKREVHFFPYTARRTKLLGRLTKLLYGRG